MCVCVYIYIYIFVEKIYNRVEKILENVYFSEFFSGIWTDLLLLHINVEKCYFCVLAKIMNIHMGEGANQIENEPENLFHIVLHTTVVLQWVQRECSFSTHTA